MTSALTAELASGLIERAAARGATLATAESCTGGMIAAALTDIPGASSVFGHGYITYANEAKTGMLGVPADLIALHGAVSAPVALAMAKGALKASAATLAVAVTGIAGPGGGSPSKPVGLVYIAVADRDGAVFQRFNFANGSRATVRLRSVNAALRMLTARLTH